MTRLKELREIYKTHSGQVYLHDLFEELLNIAEELEKENKELREHLGRGADLWHKVLESVNKKIKNKQRGKYYETKDYI